MLVTARVYQVMQGEEEDTYTHSTEVTYTLTNTDVTYTLTSTDVTYTLTSTHHLSIPYVHTYAHIVFISCYSSQCLLAPLSLLYPLAPLSPLEPLALLPHSHLSHNSHDYHSFDSIVPLSSHTQVPVGHFNGQGQASTGQQQGCSSNKSFKSMLLC